MEVITNEKIYFKIIFEHDKAVLFCVVTIAFFRDLVEMLMSLDLPVSILPMKLQPVKVSSALQNDQDHKYNF